MSTVIKIEDFFPEDIFTSLTKASSMLKKNTFLLDWDEKFNRYAGYDLSLFMSLKDKVEQILKEKLYRSNLEFSFCYYSHYLENGVCPPHKDRKECLWTLNICLEQDFIWPIFIDGEAYHLKPNQALFYQGSELIHWREQNKSGKTCDLCVYCFVEKSL